MKSLKGDSLLDCISNTKLKITDECIIILFTYLFIEIVIFSFVSYTQIVKPISLYKNDEKTKYIKPIHEYYVFKSKFYDLYKTYISTESWKQYVIGIIINSKRKESESLSLLFALDVVTYRDYTIGFRIYDNKNELIEEMKEYFHDYGIKFFIGLLNKEEMKEYDEYLKSKRTKFYNYGYPHEDEFCYKYIFQLNSISDYMSFISYPYLTDHYKKNILVFEDDRNMKDLNEYIYKLINQFNWILPNITINNNENVNEIVKKIIALVPDSGNIMLLLSVSLLNRIISNLRYTFVDPYYSIYLLNYNINTPIENEIFYSYINYDFNTPLTSKIYPDHLTALFSNILKGNIKYNKYNFLDNSYYIYKGRDNFVIRIPSNSTIFYKKIEFYQIKCKIQISNTDVITPILQKPYGLLFDYSYDVNNMLLGFEIETFTYPEMIVYFIPIFYENDDNDQSFLQKINKFNDTIKIFIGLTIPKNKKLLEDYLNEQNSLLYYVGNSVDVSCLKNIIHMGKNLISIFPTYLGVTHLYCSSVIIFCRIDIYNLNDFDIFINELKYHSVDIMKVYYLTETTNIDISFMKQIKSLLTFMNICILNFMSEWSKYFISELDSMYDNYQDFKIISLELNLDKDFITPKHFTHYIIITDILKSEYIKQDISIPYYNQYNVYCLFTNKLLITYVSLAFILFYSKNVDPYEDMNGFIKEEQLCFDVQNLVSCSVSSNLLLTQAINIMKDVGFNEKVNQRITESMNLMLYMYSQPYLARKPNICNWIENNNGNYITEEIISFGFLFDMNGREKISDYNIMIASMYIPSASESLQYSVTYEIYDTGGSSVEKCLEGFKYFINNNTKYIIFGNNKYECLLESEKILNSEEYKTFDIIVLYPNKFPGHFCDKRYVMTGLLPNQYFNPTLFYYISVNATMDIAYLLYDSKSNESIVYKEVLESFLKHSPMDYLIYDINKIDKLEYGKILLNKPGLNYILIPVNDELISLVSHIHFINAYQKNILLLVMQNEEDIVYFEKGTLEGFDLVDSLFSTNDISDTYMSLFLGSYVISDSTSHTSNAFSLFLYINDMLKMEITSPSKSIEMIYGNSRDLSELLLYKLHGNNYFTKKLQLVRIQANNKLDTLFTSEDSYNPDPFYDYYDYNILRCDFQGNQIEYLQATYMILIDSQYDNVFKHFVFFYIDNFIKYPPEGYIFKAAAYLVSSNEMCENEFDYYFTHEQVTVFVVINIDVCKEELIKKYDVWGKAISVITNRPLEHHYVNTFVHGLPITNTLRPILLQLSIIDYSKPVVFIINPIWKKYYDWVEYLLPEYGLNLLYRVLSTNQENIIERVRYLVSNHPNGFHLFIEEKVPILEEIIKEVNLLTKNNKDGLFDYISYIEAPDYFLEDPYYIRIGTYLHEVSEEDRENFSVFFNELDERFQNGYPSIYFSFYISLNTGFYVVAANMSSDYDSYRPYHYDFLYTTMEGNQYMDYGNFVPRRLSIAYSPNNIYTEYYLGYTTSFMDLYKFSDEKLEFYDCRVYNTSKMDENKKPRGICSRTKAKMIKIALVVPNMKSNSLLLKSILYPFFLYDKYYHLNRVYPSADDNFYYPFIRLCDMNEVNTLMDCINNIMKEGEITFIITNLDYVKYIGNVRNSEAAILYDNDLSISQLNKMILNIGHGKSDYKSPIYSIGPSLDSISSEIYLSIMRTNRNIVYILYASDQVLSYSSKEQFVILFDSIGFEIKYIELNKQNITLTLEDLKNCYMSSKCSFINTIPCSESYFIYTSFDDNGEWDTYILFEDIVAESIKVCYFVGSYFISGYNSLLKDSGYSFINETTSQYIDFINTYLFPSYKKYEINCYAYDIILICYHSFEKISKYDLTTMSEIILYREYNSPSGIISFSNDNFLNRYLYIGKIKSESFFEIQLYTDLYSSTSMSYSFNTNNIYIGLLLDFGGNEETLSKNIVLFSDVVLLYFNEQSATNNITYTIKKYALHRKNETEDIETIYRLLNDEEIISITGCSSFYCYDLFMKYFDSSYNKLFYPLLIPYEDICNRYVIPLRQPVQNKIKALFEYGEINVSEKIIFIYDNKTERLIKSMKLDKYEIEYYLYPFNELMNMSQFFNRSNGLTILNFINSDYIRDFIIEYKSYNYMENKHGNHLFFYTDAYQLGLDLAKHIIDDMIVYSFYYDSSSTSTITFYSYLQDKLSFDLYISQTMLTLEGVLSIIKNSYEISNTYTKLIIENSKLVNYLQIASQQECTSILIGKIKGTDSNSFVDHCYVSSVNNDGIIGRTFQIGSEIQPFENSDTICELSKKKLKYEFSSVVLIGIIIVSVLLSIAFLSLWILLERYKSSALFKYDEVMIIKMLLLSGYLFPLVTYFINMNYKSTFHCQFVSGLTYFLYYNMWFVIVNMTKWIEKMYSNKLQIKVYKYKFILIRTVVFDLMYIIFLLVFSAFAPFSFYYEKENTSKSDYITFAYYPQCNINTTFLIIHLLLFVSIITICLLRLYKIKMIQGEFALYKYLTRSISWGGFMSVIYFVSVLLIDEFNELLYFIEEFLITSFGLGMNLIILLPKLYYIYRHEMSLSSEAITTTNTTITTLTNHTKNKQIELIDSNIVMKKMKNKNRINLTTLHTNNTNRTRNAY